MPEENTAATHVQPQETLEPVKTTSEGEVQKRELDPEVQEAIKRRDNALKRAQDAEAQNKQYAERLSQLEETQRKKELEDLTKSAKTEEQIRAAIDTVNQSWDEKLKAREEQFRAREKQYEDEKLAREKQDRDFAMRSQLKEAGLKESYADAVIKGGFGDDGVIGDGASVDAKGLVERLRRDYSELFLAEPPKNITVETPRATANVDTKASPAELVEQLVKQGLSTEEAFTRAGEILENS